MSVGVGMDELFFRIAKVIISELKLEDVTPETFSPDLDLIDELGVDSMDLNNVLSFRMNTGLRSTKTITRSSEAFERSQNIFRTSLRAKRTAVG